jgi:hypothetical protein
MTLFTCFCDKINLASKLLPRFILPLSRAVCFIRIRSLSDLFFRISGIGEGKNVRTFIGFTIAETNRFRAPPHAEDGAGGLEAVQPFHDGAFLSYTELTLYLILKLWISLSGDLGALQCLCILVEPS